MFTRQARFGVPLILCLAAGVALGGVAARPAHVAAASSATVAVTPTTIPLGGQISLSGSGFAAGEAVTVTLSGMGVPLVLLSARPDGSVAATTLTVPAIFHQGTQQLALAPGVHTLTLTGRTSARSANIPLTVEPVLTLSASAIPLGGTVSVSGAGFAAGEAVTLALSQVPGALLTLRADPYGQIPSTQVTIPTTVKVGTQTQALAPGAHTLTLTGSASQRSATAQLTLEPMVALSAPSVALGGTVTVSGAGFAAGEQVTVALSQMAGTLATLTVDANGLLPPTPLTIPTTFTENGQTLAVSPGTHMLTVTGVSSRRTAGAPLTLVPGVTLSSTTIPLGGQIDLSAAGFAAREQVTVALSQMNGALATASAGPNGLLQLTHLTIPATFTVGTALRGLSPGTHTLTLTGTSSQRSLTTQVTLVPSLTLSATTVPQGGQVTLSAAGFSANEPVAATLSGVAGRLAAPRADNNGLVAPTALTVPATVPQGPRTLTMTGLTSGRSAAMAITVGPPVAAPTLSVTPSSTNPGGLITLSGGGFAPAEAVSIMLRDVNTTLGTITANAQGQLPATDLSLPYSLALGAHTLQATGTVSRRSASTGLTVVALAPALSLSATSLSPGAIVSVTGHGFGRQEQVTLALNGVVLSTTPPVITTANGAFSALFTVPAGVMVGANALSAVGTQSRVSTSISVQGVRPVVTTLYFAGAVTGPASAPEPAHGVYWTVQVAMNLRPSSGPVPTSSILVPAGTQVKEWGRQPGNGWIHVTWARHNGYLLAGNMAPVAAGAPLNQDTLAILNTSNQPAHIDLIFYYRSGRAPGHASLGVAPHSRATADLNMLAGDNRMFGIKLSADRAVSARLEVRRGGLDGYGLLGVPAPDTTWYLAEGYTGGDFHESLMLVNPGRQTAQVNLQLVGGPGQARRSATVGLAAQSTAVVDVNRLLPGQAVGVIATASQPIVLARTITFGPRGYGSTASMGTNRPATTWLFAGGQTSAGFRPYLSVLNPNAEEATVTVRFYGDASGALGGRGVLVAPHQRVTVPVIRSTRDTNIAAVVTGDRPVVVERSAYVNVAGTSEVAASDVLGRTGTGLSWAFPGGDRQARDEVLHVFNPSARTALIVLTVYGTDGSVTTRQISVQPAGQTLIDVRALAADVTAQYGLLVRAANGLGVVAERTAAAPGDASLQSSQGMAT